MHLRIDDHALSHGLRGARAGCQRRASAERRSNELATSEHGVESSPLRKIMRATRERSQASVNKNPRSRTERRKTKKPSRGGLSCLRESGTDLLSRGIPRTIIGAAPFHGPVRDGKEWFQSALGTRHSLSHR